MGKTLEKELLELFDPLWRSYPRKEGKKTALKHFKTALKTYGKDVISQISQAIEYYINMTKSKDKEYIMHGKTFFCNWEDYYEMAKEEKAKQKEVKEEKDKAEYSRDEFLKITQMGE